MAGARCDVAEEVDAGRLDLLLVAVDQREQLAVRRDAGEPGEEALRGVVGVVVAGERDRRIVVAGTDEQAWEAPGLAVTSAFSGQSGTAFNVPHTESMRALMPGMSG